MSPPVKPVPAKRSRSPDKKQQSNSWSTSSFRRPPRHWPEDQREKQVAGPAIYRAPPSLDLSTLKDSTLVSESDPSRSPTKKSPAASPKVALIKVTEKEREAGMTEEELECMKRNTMVFVVRSQSDVSPRKNEEVQNVCSAVLILTLDFYLLPNCVTNNPECYLTA